jgi:hypothetical protein
MHGPMKVKLKKKMLTIILKNFPRPVILVQHRLPKSHLVMLETKESRHIQIKKLPCLTVPHISLILSPEFHKTTTHTYKISTQICTRLNKVAQKSLDI